jgi:nitrous oxidase accessory protein
LTGIDVARPLLRGLIGLAILVAIESARLVLPAMAADAEGMGAPPQAASGGASTETPQRPAGPGKPGLPWFQTLVDAAPAGSVLRPPPGEYAGPVLVDKPLVIDGGGKVGIDAGGRGTVFVLATSGATLRGLHLKGSGVANDNDDACLNVRGNHNTIESLQADDCLFGIDLKQSDDNVVRGNRISSKPLELGMRGDAIRLWYSKNNLIEGNDISDTRDTVAWYSNHNIFRNNVGRRSRYSLHFMFANDNLVEGNRFYDNAVGIYLMYTERVNVRNNIISHATGASGMAIGFKESSDSVVEGNEIIYCAVGIGSDVSPFQPGTKILIRGNRIAYNGIGIQFTSELGGNEISDNIFEGNLTHVSYGVGRAGAGHNEWHGNYWDDYQGFDRNGDGIGDTPYDLYAYTDQIWAEIPAARFFKESPVLELLDFLERLAPFSSPNLLLRDPSPRFVKPAVKT